MRKQGMWCVCIKIPAFFVSTLSELFTYLMCPKGKKTITESKQKHTGLH